MKWFIVLVLALSLAGCASPEVNTTKNYNLIKVKKGLTFTAKEDGWYLSDKSVCEILKDK